MADSPTKVLHVVGSLERGGVETWLLELLALLDRSRWQFDICTLGPDCGRYAEQARAWGSRVWACPASAGAGGRWGFPLRFYRALCAGGYAIVHSHVHHFSGLVLAVARVAGAAVRLAHSHNTHDGQANSLRRACYRAAAGALLGRTQTMGLACSAESAEALFGARRQSGAPVELLRYGLGGQASQGAPEGERRRLRRSFGFGECVPVLGHVGRLERQKNHEFLLEVAAAVHTRLPNAHWLLVGEGEGRGRLERQARGLGLETKVIFAGRREDVPALLRSVMDAFVFPSLHEGLPLALLEAQAAGLRSLASSRITREAAVVPGAVEFLALEAGPRVWARRVEACLEAGKISRQMAWKTLEAAGFSAQRSLERLLEIYRRALGRQARGAAR